MPDLKRHETNGANPSNKYMILPPLATSYHYNNYTDDWGGLEVYPNAVTGKMPIQRQGFLPIQREFPENNMPIKIIGFGDDHDDQTLNLTAHLKTTSTPLTITDKLISQNLSDYGNISFKDPG